MKRRKKKKRKKAHVLVNWRRKSWVILIKNSISLTIVITGIKGSIKGAATQEAKLCLHSIQRETSRHTHSSSLCPSIELPSPSMCLCTYFFSWLLFCYSYHSGTMSVLPSCSLCFSTSLDRNCFCYCACITQKYYGDSAWSQKIKKT